MFECDLESSLSNHPIFAAPVESKRKIKLLFQVIYFEGACFGASEATIFSKRGSPCNGSQNGCNFSRPYVTALGIRVRISSCCKASSFSPVQAQMMEKN